MKPISQMTKEEFRSFLTNTDFNISDYVDEGNTADGFIYDYLKHLNINADRTDFICAIPSPEEGYNLRDLYVSSIDKFIILDAIELFLTSIANLSLKVVFVIYSFCIYFKQQCK